MSRLPPKQSGIKRPSAAGLPAAPSASGLRPPSASSTSLRPTAATAAPEAVAGPSGLRPPASRVSQPVNQPRPGPSGVRRKVPAAASAATVQQKPPSDLQKQVFKKALEKSARDPHHKVQATGAKQTRVQPPIAQTKRGKERVLQQMITEETIQRTPQAEYIATTLTGIDTKPEGHAIQMEMTQQKIDPTHATESAGVNQTVSVTSTVSVTTDGKKTSRSVMKRTVKSEKLSKLVNENPDHIKRLVREENEDVVNTLRIAPPAIVQGDATTKAPLKKRLQNLRLNSEAMGLLRNKVVIPAPTADEAETESPPDVLAAIMGAVEKGAVPQSDPNQVFNTLFPSPREENVAISSVAPGPLQDIVIPTAEPREDVDKSFSEEMQRAVVDVQNTPEPPRDDVCTEQSIAAPKRGPKSAEKKMPRTITDEVPPWGKEDVLNLSALVGGKPIFNMEASDVTMLEEPQQCSKELSKGIDFFLDSDTVAFENRVQLRGSKLPAWFPGYMSVFSHLPDVVQVNRTPSIVLQHAWRAVQPNLFAEESVLIV